MVMAVVLYRIPKSFPSYNGRKVAVFLAVSVGKHGSIKVPTDKYQTYNTYNEAKIYTMVNSVHVLHEEKCSAAYPSLEIHCPTLIKPEMFPRGTSDEIAAPTMRQLMRNNIDIFSVLRLMLII
jgi:hypothetical protein